MPNFTATYDDEEGLFPIEYRMRGTYSAMEPEPDIGIFSGGISDVHIDRVDIVIGSIVVSVPDAKGMVDQFNEKSCHDLEFAGWLEDEINRQEEEARQPRED